MSWVNIFWSLNNRMLLLLDMEVQELTALLSPAEPYSRQVETTSSADCACR